jgi:hypothetical protein
VQLQKVVKLYVTPRASWNACVVPDDTWKEEKLVAYGGDGGDGGGESEMESALM